MTNTDRNSLIDTYADAILDDVARNDREDRDASTVDYRELRRALLLQLDDLIDDVEAAK